MKKKWLALSLFLTLVAGVFSGCALFDPRERAVNQYNAAYLLAGIGDTISLHIEANMTYPGAETERTDTLTQESTVEYEKENVTGLSVETYVKCDGESYSSKTIYVDGVSYFDSESFGRFCSKISVEEMNRRIEEENEGGAGGYNIENYETVESSKEGKMITITFHTPKQEALADLYEYYDNYVDTFVTEATVQDASGTVVTDGKGKLDTATMTISGTGLLDGQTQAFQLQLTTKLLATDSRAIDKPIDAEDYVMVQDLDELFVINTAMNDFFAASESKAKVDLAYEFDGIRVEVAADCRFACKADKTYTFDITGRETVTTKEGRFPFDMTLSYDGTTLMTKMMGETERTKIDSSTAIGAFVSYCPCFVGTKAINGMSVTPEEGKKTAMVTLNTDGAADYFSGVFALTDTFTVDPTDKQVVIVYTEDKELVSVTLDITGTVGEKPYSIASTVTCGDPA